jgi:glycosyltransferase involved in cell wall biosynthesis
MIKLVLVIASNGKAIGGMEKQVATQARYLAMHKEIDITVVAHAAYKELFTAPVRFCAIDTSRSRRNPFLLWHLTRQLKQLQPDLIHAHGHKATALLAKLNKQLVVARRIATAHGTKKSSNFFANMDYVFAVSKGVQNSLLPIQSKVIGNAVEPCTASALSKRDICEQYELNSSLPLLVACGRLAPVKQYDRLMTACQNLDVSLLICGDGPERARLDHLQTPHIRLAGEINQAQRMMRHADALVISSDREGFSLSMIEALQQNTLVLSTKVSGTDLLPAACLIDASNSDTLRNSLQEKLARLPELRVQSEPAFKFAQEQCAPELLVDSLVKQYHTLLSTEPTA